MVVSEREYNRLQAEAGLAEFDALLERQSNYASAALLGGLAGAIVGSFVVKRREPAERHALKYAAIGAGVNMLLSYGLVKLGRHMSEYAHTHPGYKELVFSAPMTPVVTSGEFTGAPRHLYHANHAHHARYDHR
jgi:hypothetical protein